MQHLEAECLRKVHDRAAEFQDPALMPLRRRGAHELRHDDLIDDWPILRANHGALNTLADRIRGRSCYV